MVLSDQRDFMKRFIYIFFLVLSSLSATESRRYLYATSRHDDQKLSDRLPYGEVEYQGFLQASYTYWVPRQLGLATFQTNYYAPAVSQSAAATGETFYPKISGQSGFKISAGVFSPLHKWGLLAEYTWFSNKKAPVTSYNFPSANAWGLWIGDNVIAGSVQWRNSFQRFDLELSSQMETSAIFTLNPYASFIVAWDREWFDMFTNTNTITDSSHFNYTQKWWGVGPSAGFRGSFYLYKSDYRKFRLLLKGGIGQVWATNNLTFTIETNENPRNVLYDVGNSYSEPNPVIDLNLGLGTIWIPKGHPTTSICLNASWQQQSWFYHTLFTTPASSSPQEVGTFFLQGFTLDLSFIF